jgi:hypothetical protein
VCLAKDAAPSRQEAGSLVTTLATESPDAFHPSGTHRRRRARALTAVGLASLLAATGLAVAPDATAAGASGTVVFQQNFDSGSSIPSGITVHAGTWTISGQRLVGTATGSTRSRVSFGPSAPTDFLFESTVRFQSVVNSARWINLGVDYHAASDYGAVAVLRSATTASNGVELAQKSSASGSWTSNPVAAAPDDLSVGEDHDVAVEVHGSQYVVRMDGVPVMSGTNLNRTGGGFGFVINQSTVQFDDIMITELAGDHVVYDEDFSGSGIPSGITVHAGTWTVTGNRLVGTATGSTRSRVSFGPTAPDDFPSRLPCGSSPW